MPPCVYYLVEYIKHTTYNEYIKHIVVLVRVEYFCAVSFFYDIYFGLKRAEILVILHYTQLFL